MSDQFSAKRRSRLRGITWRDAGEEPQCAPNPAYPQGKDVNVSFGAGRTCKADLPYPSRKRFAFRRARRIGAYLVKCRICGYTSGCTTAGRPDDPRSITVPCKAVATA